MELVEVDTDGRTAHFALGGEMAGHRSVPGRARIAQTGDAFEVELGVGRLDAAREALVEADRARVFRVREGALLLLWEGEVSVSLATDDAVTLMLANEAPEVPAQKQANITQIDLENADTLVGDDEDGAG